MPPGHPKILLKSNYRRIGKKGYWMIFQAGNVHESASLFNLKEKKYM